MPWFTRNKPAPHRSSGPTAAAQPQPRARVESVHLSVEPSMLALAQECIAAAGPEHTASPSAVLTGIYGYATAQVRQAFTALRRPDEGDGFEALYSLPGFTDQVLWDYLTGDPGRIAVHNHLAEQLASEPVRDALIGGIRAGHYT